MKRAKRNVPFRGRYFHGGAGSKIGTGDCVSPRLFRRGR